MANVLKIFGLIITWAPMVLRIVQSVEQLIKGTSEEKKAAAMKMVKEYFVARNIAWTAEREKLFSALIDVAVQALNWFGAWRQNKAVSA